MIDDLDISLSCKLEMLRGLRNRFYFALRDDGAASDSLNVISFMVEDDKLVFAVEGIPAPYTGEILALEMDPLNTNDVESTFHDNQDTDEW